MTARKETTDARGKDRDAAPPPFRQRLLSPTASVYQRMCVTLASLVVASAYVALLFGFMFPQDWREESRAYVLFATGAFLVRTFIFHFGLVLALFVVTAACLKHARMAAFALPLWIVCHGPALLSCLPRSSASSDAAALKVMSANLLGSNTDTEGILAEITAFQPDILVLQEYRPHWHEALWAALRDDYPYSCFEIRRDNFGQALYSRFPFARRPETELPLGDAATPQTRAVVRFGGRELAVYNIHLMPPMGVANARRHRREFADLLDRLAREELPVILCGDFNFTNDSAFADDLARLGLADVHRLCGRGLGTTWPVVRFYRYLPGLRLDHIFISKELSGVESGVGVGRGSDHRPIQARVRL